VDPSGVLGLKVGDAAMMRSVGSQQPAGFAEIPVSELDSKFARDPCVPVRLDVGITRALVPDQPQAFSCGEAAC
jgi:hypothetical protein